LALRFAVVGTSNVGRTQCKWLLSLELGELSQVVCVDEGLFIEGSTSDPMGSGDFDDPLLAISFDSTMSELLKPGVKTHSPSDSMTDQWVPIYSTSTSKHLHLCAID
jgi:hypothetical protein